MKRAAFILTAFILTAVFTSILVRNGLAMENRRIFEDVSESHWAFGYISRACERGLEVDGNLFEPEKSVTRAEFVQMISEHFKLPASDRTTRYYEDIESSSEYFNAVAAAKSAGILEGIKEDEPLFMPDRTITREEAASVLSLTASYLGIVSSMQYIDLDGVYEDYPQIDRKYNGAVQAVYRLGIMKGTTEITFAPKELVTRAQAVVMMERLIDTAERVLD